MSDYMQGDKDNAVSVPFSDDETPEKAALKELDEEESPNASPEERITRKQKRQARLQQLLQDGNKNAEENKALKDELGSLKGELAQLKGFVAAQAQQRQAPADSGKDPFEAELDAVYTRQRNAFNAAQAEIKAGTYDESRQAYYEKEAREIERDKARIHTRRELAQQEPVRRAEQGQQRWVQAYPDVYRNAAAYEYAEGTFKRRKAQGEAVTDELVHEVMKETMTTFRLGPKQAPSASEKSRLSGQPSSGSGGGGPRSSSVQMTPELRRMATAAYSHLPEDEAIKAWVNKTGKKMREKKLI